MSLVEFPISSPTGFELLSEIGHGGMGVVFRARDTAFDRDVAVKLLKGDPDSPATRRFLEEAKITARLQHPGIPAVYQTGELPDGRPFLAMKLIEGQTFAELLKSEGFGVAKWLGVFESVCQAVGAAHAAGYMHRDLKPANVMVGAFGEVQVMDWGLAKKIPASPRGGAERTEPSSPSLARSPDPSSSNSDETLPADPNHTNAYTPDTDDAADSTKAGTVMGTPSYMAPEQARGDVNAVSQRSDVFALGCILCELLTGKPPLTGKAGPVIAAVAAGRFDDAFARLDGCGEDRELIALAKRCLTVTPSARPADATEVAVAVGGFRSAAEARAKAAEVDRGRAEARAGEQRKRQRVMVWSAGSVVAVLLAGLGVSLLLLKRAVFAEGQATANLQQATEERNAKDGASPSRVRNSRIVLVSLPLAIVI